MAQMTVGGRELSEPLRAERFLRLLAGKESGRNSQKTLTHQKESTRHCWFEGRGRRDAGGPGAESQPGSGDLAAASARIWIPADNRHGFGGNLRAPEVNAAHRHWHFRLGRRRVGNSAILEYGPTKL